MSKDTYQKRTGHSRDKVVHKGNNIKAIRRRQTALANLENQKNQIEVDNSILPEPLDLEKDHNYIRIKKEIATLKAKL